MKNSSNLRAAKQLETVGKYSGAISCLEEFLTENPDYEKKDQINKKLEHLKGRLNNEGDSVIQLNFKALLEIPISIIKSAFELLFETIFGWLIIAIIIGVIYFVSKL